MVALVAKTVSSVSKYILEEKVRLLFMQAPISNATVFAISLLFYVLLHPLVESMLPAYWLAALYLTAGFRLILWGFRDNQPDRFSAGTWLKLYIIGSFLVGVSWSLVVPLIYVADDLTVAIALSMLVFGVVASAVVILSVHVPAFIAYSYPMILTLIGTLLWYGDKEHLVLAVATVVYLIMTTLFTRNINRNVIRGMELQAQNRDLIDELSQGVEQRERAVRQRTSELQEKNTALTREIADRKRAESALRESEQRLSAFFGSSPAGMALYDTEFRYLRVNETMAEMHGLSPDEHPGKSLADVLQGNASLVEELFQQILDTKQPFSNLDLSGEMPTRPGEQSHFTVSYFPVPGFDDTIQGLGAVVIDITERKKAEQALRVSEERFELAMRGSNDGVYDWNLVSNEIYYSPRWKSMLGYADHELPNDFSVWEELIDTEDREASWDMLTDYINGRRQNFALEFKMRHKDGHWVDILSRAFLVRDDAGKAVRVVGTHVDISEKKRQEEQIRRQAHYDDLTHLPNRFLAMDRLTQLLKESERTGQRVAVLFLDLDGFKRVNDTLGHETGDLLLIEAASRLKSSVRQEDSVCRLGGDEFIVLVRDLAQPEDVRPIAANLISRFRGPFDLQGRELVVTTSIGIAVSPDDGRTPAQLLRKADTAMYHSKEQGRNSYNFFTEAMNRDVSRRLALEEHMHGALKHGEFSVLYQPLICLDSMHVAGAEALLRWNNPTLGEVSPAEFIPIAEQTGMIEEIGAFVLKQALMWTRDWRQLAGDSFRIAVNLSPRQFRDPGLVRMVEDALRNNDLPADILELEITEGVLIAAQDSTLESLCALNDMGVSVAMDDFGTGYSSLSYLRRYPFSTLKIDRSFIHDISLDPADRELVNAAILMARGLDLKVVAEGVETEDQLAFIRKKDCQYAQGFLFSPAIEAEALSGMLRKKTESESLA